MNVTNTSALVANLLDSNSDEIQVVSRSDAFGDGAEHRRFLFE